jgi:hypothetical protein
VLEREPGKKGKRRSRAKIPGPLERRHLIERDIAPAQALKTAEAYLAEGRSIEAVEFLAKAGDEEGLQALRGEALESGDLFLFRAVASAMEQPPDREEWLKLAAAAEAAGKQRYATDARRQAERGEG